MQELAGRIDTLASIRTSHESYMTKFTEEEKARGRR